MQFRSFERISYSIIHGNYYIYALVSLRTIMHTSQIYTDFRQFITLLVLIPLIVLSSCKKEDKTVDDAPDKIIGAVNINGAYTTYTRSTLAIYLNSSQEIENYLVISRVDNSQIALRFPGTDESEFTLSPSDTLVSIEYRDASQRVFIADSGRISISNYNIANDIFTISGGFEFHASRTEQFGELSNTFHIRGFQGGFIDITNK